jgi:hypothetical protein
MERPSPVPLPTSLVVKKGSRSWGPRGDPLAVVGDLDRDRVVALAPCGDHDRLLGFVERRRVGDEG